MASVSRRGLSYRPSVPLTIRSRPPRFQSPGGVYLIDRRLTIPRSHLRTSDIPAKTWRSTRGVLAPDVLSEPWAASLDDASTFVGGVETAVFGRSRDDRQIAPEVHDGAG